MSFTLLLLFLGREICFAAPEKNEIPKPSLAAVSYGPESKQLLDFWKAGGDRLTPVVIWFHGGSWKSGSRSLVTGRQGCSAGFGLAEFLKAGISVVSVDYRFIGDANKAGIVPPVKWPLSDAARAVQFVRSKAGEWKLDPQRFALSGESAGGCTALWLSLHPDLADAKSSDPILRQSTRVACAAVVNAQTSLDPREVRDWFNNPDVYGGHAFGIEKLRGESPEARFARLEAAREKILPWIKEYSPIELASADAPPICFYTDKKPPGTIPHGALYGQKMKEKLDALGVECEVLYPGATAEPKEANHIAFLLRKLMH